jgi:RNA polymerase sigma-70 factor (ECF subfamily)
MDDGLRERLAARARRVLRDAHEAEDIAQEALLRAPHGAAARAVDLRAWLHAVCYRLAIDRLRARRREARALAVLALREVEADDSLERSAQAERVLAHLSDLPEPYRRAVTLRYLEGLTFPEIAMRMNALERTVRTWVGRGLDRLRRRLADEEPP